MENPQDPKLWNLRQQLAFLLLTAADVDGRRSQSEMRLIKVELGAASADEMLAWMLTQTAAERETVLHHILDHLAVSQDDRQKLQRMLRDVFMADGEYGPAEQAMTRKISDWIRAASAD
jgi:uncharacterized tellurite resistance protein B-like protein